MEENTQILNRLHYLFTKSDGKYVAHCLDLDLASSGKTIQEAKERLNACVELQIVSCYQDKNYSQLAFQSPDSYWEEFDKAEKMPDSFPSDHPPGSSAGATRQTLHAPQTAGARGCYMQRLSDILIPLREK